MATEILKWVILIFAPIWKDEKLFFESKIDGHTS